MHLLQPFDQLLRDDQVWPGDRYPSFRKITGGAPEGVKTRLVFGVMRTSARRDRQLSQPLNFC